MQFHCRRCGDYHGIQLVQRLARLPNAALKKAEIDFYFNNFNEAEQAYIEMDRADLAIEMRSKLGDWFRVEKLIVEHGSDDTTLAAARNHIGEYYYDRHKWSKAAQYYAKVITHFQRFLDTF